MKKLLFIFLTCSTFISCGYDPATKELREYLTEKKGIEPANNNIYLFIPSNQCHNCIFLDGTNLDPALKKRLYIITAISPKHMINFEHVYYDKSDHLQSLKLVDYENKFVFFDNGRVSLVAKAKITQQDITDCARPNE
jgi:hypothetical protein